MAAPCPPPAIAPIIAPSAPTAAADLAVRAPRDPLYSETSEESTGTVLPSTVIEISCTVSPALPVSLPDSCSFTSFTLASAPFGTTTSLPSVMGSSRLARNSSPSLIPLRIHGVDQPDADLGAAGQFPRAALLDHQRQNTFADARLLQIDDPRRVDRKFRGLRVQQVDDESVAESGLDQPQHRVRIQRLPGRRLPRHRQEMIRSLTPSFFKSMSAEVSLASREPCWSIRFVMKSSLSPALLSFTRSELRHRGLCAQNPNRPKQSCDRKHQ